MGKYSSDSGSVDSYRRSKKKSRHRSSSESSSSGRTHSSSRHKKCKKYRKKAARSRSREKDKRSRSSRKHSRDKDRYSKKSRSRSRSYSTTRSPARHRHRSKESDDGSSRRSRSRDRRRRSRSRSHSPRRRSRSRSHSSRRRSRSRDRKQRDDGAELLERLNKAAMQAMADNSKLREATINLVNQVAERESAILEINKASFAPKSFSSSVSERKEELATIVELPEPTKIDVSLKDNPSGLLHPNLLLEDADEKLSRWIRKLYSLRQRAISNELFTSSYS